MQNLAVKFLVRILRLQSRLGMDETHAMDPAVVSFAGVEA